MKFLGAISGFTCGALCLLLFTGCGQGPEKTPRKKMPEFTSFAEWSSSGACMAGANEGLPFGVGELELMAGGRLQGFTYIAMSDPASDSLVMNLINTYKPFAIPMLTQWYKQEKKGVLIDCRTETRGAYETAEYRVEAGSAFSIPVVFVWNRFSAERAAWLTNALQSYTAVSCRQITGAEGADLANSLKCSSGY